ncbi:hypothetical protein Tco_1274030 [Tanacetum coccineum]
MPRIAEEFLLLLTGESERSGFSSKEDNQLLDFSTTFLITPDLDIQTLGGARSHQISHVFCFLIISLMYLTSSKPDLIYAVRLCARYQAKATKKHLLAVKWIFRYLKGTINMGLWYSKDTYMSLTAYVDADPMGCQDTRRSTSGSA